MASLFDNVYEDCNSEKKVEGLDDAYVCIDVRTGLKFSIVKKVPPIEIYTNYLTFISNLLSSDVLSAKSYFDWGMVPIWMPPSFFMEDELSISFNEIFAEKDLTTYSLPSRTLIGDGAWPKQRNGTGIPKEIWAFRDDIKNKFGENKNVISIIKEVYNASKT